MTGLSNSLMGHAELRAQNYDARVRFILKAGGDGTLVRERRWASENV